MDNDLFEISDFESLTPKSAMALVVRSMLRVKDLYLRAKLPYPSYLGHFVELTIEYITQDSPYFRERPSIEKALANAVFESSALRPSLKAFLEAVKIYFIDFPHKQSFTPQLTGVINYSIRMASELGNSKTMKQSTVHDLGYLRARASEFPKKSEGTVIQLLLGEELWPFGNEATVDPSGEDFINSDPSIAVIWDPRYLSVDEYSTLVGLLGDLVRAEGGLGIERVRSQGVGIVSAAVPV